VSLSEKCSACTIWIHLRSKRAAPETRKSVADSERSNDNVVVNNMRCLVKLSNARYNLTTFPSAERESAGDIGLR
jgi:hypothetical protein